jgi:8-oxo-dGTP pyrophosphatase MutT (NUDIX family)/predicted subunit of tRNA(5-methylaminomethyl-2-thiouridylate) methyltransferase
VTRQKIVVLFSGGRDSSLTACLLAKEGYAVHLLTAYNGAVVKGDISDYRYQELRAAFPDNIVHREIVPSFSLFRRIAIATIEADFVKYRTNLIPVGDAVASHAEAIVYALKNNIPSVASGFASYENRYPEQTPSVISLLRSFLSEYGLSYLTPVYSYRHVDDVKYALFDFGVSTKSLEGTSLFADSYSVPDTSALLEYVQDKLSACREYIKMKLPINGALETSEITSSAIERIIKVGAIIRSGKKLLVVRKVTPDARAEFIIPGGRQEKGESDRDTLERELKEELSVELQDMKHFGSFDETAIFEKMPLHMEVYEASVRGAPVCRSEIKEYAWVERDYESKGYRLGSVLSRHVIPRLVDEGLM